MAKCGKSCADACCSKVKTKRKATARRPARPAVVKGQTLTILGGTEQQYVNSLMANLQAAPFRNAAQPVFPNYPSMLGTTTQGLPEAATRIPPLAPVMPRTTTTAVETERRPTALSYGTQTYGMQVLRRPQPATIVGETQTEQARTRPYRGGIMGVLNQVVAPSALAQQVRAIGAAEGYRRGTHAGEAVGAAAYRAAYTVRQTAGTAATLTLPEIETRFNAGEVMRPTGGRPRGAAVQAVAEEAAPK